MESDKLDAALIAHREARTQRLIAAGLSRTIVSKPNVAEFLGGISSTPSTPGGFESNRGHLLFAGAESSPPSAAMAAPTKPPSSSLSGANSRQFTPKLQAVSPANRSAAAPFARVDLYAVNPSDLLAYIEKVATMPTVISSGRPKPVVTAPAQITEDAGSAMEVDQGGSVEMQSPRLIKPLSSAIPAKFRAPIAEMGNYQEVLAKQRPLRSVDEEPNAPRFSFFGNPFARRGQRNAPAEALVDEADSAAGEAAALRGNVGGPSAKRKAPPVGSASEKDSRVRRKVAKVAAASAGPTTPPAAVASGGPAAQAQESKELAPVKPAATPVAQMQKPAKPPLMAKPKPPITNPAPQPIPTVIGAVVPLPIVASAPSKGLEALQIRGHNNAIKFSIIELIREPPSRNVEPIIAERLKNLVGDNSTRRRITKEVVLMAKQYKRPLRFPDLL